MNESKWSKTRNCLHALPKVVKSVISLVILFGIFYLGIVCNSVSISQTKTTKFGLEDVGELVTQTAYLTVVKDNKEHKDFFNLFKIPFTESRQIFSYDIEVDASVDFSNISYKINEEKSEIIVKLPHSKIYKSTLKTDSLVVYLDSSSLFTRIDLEEHNEALNAMKEQGIKEAEANGILVAADANAKRLIEGFIKGDNRYKEYKITYEYID